MRAVLAVHLRGEPFRDGDDARACSFLPRWRRSPTLRKNRPKRASSRREKIRRRRKDRLAHVRAQARLGVSRVGVPAPGVPVAHESETEHGVGLRLGHRARRGVQLQGRERVLLPRGIDRVQTVGRALVLGRHGCPKRQAPQETSAPNRGQRLGGSGFTIGSLVRPSRVENGRLAGVE